MVTKEVKKTVKSTRFCLTLLFIFASFLPFFLPYTSGLTFAQGEPAEIRHPVRVNGALPSSASCNLSVFYNNGSVLVDFQPMTDNGDYFNYTLAQSQTGIKGYYSYDLTCASQGLNQTESYDFLINYGGVQPDDQRSSTANLSVWLFMIIFLLSIIAFFFTQKVPIKLTYFFMALLFFLISLNLIFVNLQDSVVNPKFEGFYSGFTTVSYYVYWGIGVFLAFIWIVTTINYQLSKSLSSKEAKYA